MYEDIVKSIKSYLDKSGNKIEDKEILVTIVKKVIKRYVEGLLN